MHKQDRWDEQVCTIYTVTDINPSEAHMQCWAEIKPSYITGDVGMHTDRGDIAVKAQIIQTGKMGLRVLVRALTNKTSLPIQGSDSQKSFLSSSLFYPLEQLHTDHWTQSCLWPADPEHTPLEGEKKGYHHHAIRQCVHTPPEAAAQNGQRNRNITHESSSDEPQLVVHYSAWRRSISACYLDTDQKETQVRELLPLCSLSFTPALLP